MDKKWKESIALYEKVLGYAEQSLEGYKILTSPGGIGDVNVSINHKIFYICVWMQFCWVEEELWWFWYQQMKYELNFLSKIMKNS